MKKKFAAALTVTILTASGFACAPADNFSDELLTKVEAAAQNSDPKFSFGGISLGMNLQEVKNILGEPITQLDDDEFIFSNGLQIEIHKRDNSVEKIKTHKVGGATDTGVAVGMSAQKLSEIYGTADKVENKHGKTEYKYYGANGLYEIEFTVKNGVIESIEAETRD